MAHDSSMVSQEKLSEELAEPFKELAESSTEPSECLDVPFASCSPSAELIFSSPSMWLNSLINFDAPLPSAKDGVPLQLELQLRRLGCEIISQAGHLLDLPQRARCTAQVLFHRFFCRKSLRFYGVLPMAMGSVLLSCKTEASTRDSIRFPGYLVAVSWKGSGCQQAL